MTSPHSASETSAQIKALQEALAIYEVEKKLQLEQAKNIFEQSKSYQTVILGLAYGGFFAIWAAAKTFTSDARLMAVAASLMIISIFTYVVFMIVNMYLLNKTLISTIRVAQTYGSPKTVDEFNSSVQELSTRRDKINIETRRVTLFVAKLWPPFFWISVLSGILATLTMFAVLVRNGLLS